MLMLLLMLLLSRERWWSLLAQAPQQPLRDRIWLPRVPPQGESFFRTVA